MKMNSLTALRSVCDRVGTPAGEAMLEALEPCRCGRTEMLMDEEGVFVWFFNEEVSDEEAVPLRLGGC